MNPTDAVTLALLLMFFISSATVIALFRRDTRREKRLQEQFELQVLNEEYQDLLNEWSV